MMKPLGSMPLLGKMMLIGIIPFIFLLYFTVEIYRAKTDKLQLFENYQQYFVESENISRLINALQLERKYSFDYAMTRARRAELLLQRPATDSLLQTLTTSKEPSLAGMLSYTKLEDLNKTRKGIDEFSLGPNEVMHFYSNNVFRLNTLNTLPPANTPYLQPVYKTLVAQKILSEMITYLGIIQANVYNVLHTRKYMTETLVGTVGTYDIYKSYEKELLVKATPGVIEAFKLIKTQSAFAPTINYIDTLFKNFTFDSSFTASGWTEISGEGMNQLRTMQAGLWEQLDAGVEKLYRQEERGRNRAIAFLVIALLLIALLIFYIVYSVSASLKKLRLAAEKISYGQTNVLIPIEANDAIGSLAKSISIIDTTNQTLAAAAAAIGKGDFSVDVQPRSSGDELGNAVVQMKTSLQAYHEKMEQLVNLRTAALERSNFDLQQFAHVASHDLKEPLRKISLLSSRLLETETTGISETGQQYLARLDVAATRMSAMVSGILAYSTVDADKQPAGIVDFNKVMEGVVLDMELLIAQKQARILYSSLPQVPGNAILLQQLFYNLVNNALKFSRMGVPPEINVSCQQHVQLAYSKDGFLPGKYYHLKIADNGIGFKPEQADKIFGIFLRLNSKDEFEGTGLGLALCRKIVLRHGGVINAEGVPGQGSVFHVYLPETSATQSYWEKHNEANSP